MIAHAGGFLGEIRDGPYDESVTPPGEDYPDEFGTRPSDEGQRDPNEPTLPGRQPEQVAEHPTGLRHGRHAA
jgi:hypothetical protein